MKYADYYVYALLDPRYQGDFKYGDIVFSHEPMYIGKGRGWRAQASVDQDYKHTNNKKCKWVRSLKEAGLQPIIFFVKKDLRESESFRIERELISKIGRLSVGDGPLLNSTNGGEGGSQKMDEKKIDYEKELLTRGDELRLVGPMRNSVLNIEHACPEHGIVEASPYHVRQRMARGLPLCPRCGTSKRGPQMRKHRLGTGSGSYSDLMRSVQGYRLLTKYTGAAKKHDHHCEKHGVFSITPASVRQKIAMGLTPCASCNLENKKPVPKVSIVRERSRIEYVRLLNEAYQDSFVLTGEYIGSHGSVSHKCSVHGEMGTLPSEVKTRMKRGIPGCPECGRERVREITIARNKGR